MVKKLETIQDFEQLKNGDVFYHFNPFDSTDNKRVNIHKQVIKGKPKRDCFGLWFDCSEGRGFYVSDMIRDKMENFIDKGKADKFIVKYHKGSQYHEVINHHNMCDRQLF